MRDPKDRENRRTDTSALQRMCLSPVIVANRQHEGGYNWHMVRSRESARFVLLQPQCCGAVVAAFAAPEDAICITKPHVVQPR